MRTGKLLIIVTLDAYSRHEKIVECIFIQKNLSPHSLVMIFLKMFANLFVLNGLFNIQFKMGVNGPRLLEINPRPSGGFGMACLSGVNLAQIILFSLKGLSLTLPQIHYGRKVTEVNTPVILQA